MTSPKILFFTFLLTLTLYSCGNKNYRGENYISFDTMDKMAEQILQSIQEKNEAKMFGLLDNEALLLDVLFATNTPQSNQLKIRLSTKEGQSDWSREKLGKKIRIQTFFSAILEPISTQKLKNKGLELTKNKAYAAESTAMQQKYTLVLGNQEGEIYHFDFSVILWEQKYHLIEIENYLKKQ